MTTTGTMLTIGERLRIARNRSDVKVGAMAQALNRHRNMVTAYEESDEPPMWVIRRYVETLTNDTTIEWLTAEVGAPPRDLKARSRELGWIYGADPPQPALFDRDDLGRWHYPDTIAS